MGIDNCMSKFPINWENTCRNGTRSPLQCLTLASPLTKELVMMRFPKWFRSLAALVPAAMAWSLLTSAAPARAGHDSGGSDTPEILPFATGLTNPRHIRFGPDGLLYVAEAGTGGDMLPPDTEECPAVDSLFTIPPLHGYMAGFSGRISRLLPDGTRETVIDGLPSARDGFEDALGPTDIAWIESTLYALIEGGGCSRGLPDHPAGVIRIDPGGRTSMWPTSARSFAPTRLRSSRSVAPRATASPMACRTP